MHEKIINNKIKNPIFSGIKDQNSYYVGKVGYKKYLEGKIYTADNIMPIYLRNKSYKRI